MFYQHYWNAPPIQRALLTLSEVVVSTAGPLKDGEEPGANKGRTRAPEEWDSQQRQLRLEARTLKDPPGGAKAAAQDRVRRGVSGLAAAGSGRTAAWWQASALKEYADLRGLQQRLEGQAKVRRRVRVRRRVLHLNTWVGQVSMSQECLHSGWFRHARAFACRSVPLRVFHASGGRSGLLPVWTRRRHTYAVDLSQHGFACTSVNKLV